MNVILAGTVFAVALSTWRPRVSAGVEVNEGSLALQLPEPDPDVHRLLAGVGNLPGSSVSATRSQMESISPCWNTSAPIEWDNVVLYGQYILTGCSSAGAVPQKGPLLAYKITESAYTLFRRNEAENTSFRYIQRPEKQSIVWLEACGLCLNPEAPLFPQAFRANLACRLRRHR